MTAAEQYARDVLDGKYVVSRYIIQAAQRFLDFLEDPEITYDVEKANHVVDWFEKRLRYWEGEWRGQPFKLEPWQCFGLQQIFGLQKNGRRLITRVYWQIARKNAKTTTAAGMALYHLFADTEATPQILVGANNEDQAKLCTTCAANILEISPDFRPYIDDNELKIFRYKDKCSSISFPSKNGRIDAISRDLKTKDGTNPSFAVIDEYHEADDAGLLNVLRSGQGARKEPLLAVITTAGFKKDGPCYSQLRKTAIEILEGQKEDENQLALIYEPDVDDDWEVENTWLKSNPNYGISVYPHYLKERYKEASNEGGSKEVDFKTKNLNVWTDAAVVWIQDRIWMTNDAEPDKPEDIRWYGGLDIAYKRDWSAFVLTGVNSKGEYSVYPFFWIPEDTVSDKEKNEHSSLRDWINKGLVFTTPGNVTDHESIVHFILELRECYMIDSVFADPYHCIDIMNQLNKNGLETFEMPQTPNRLVQPTNMLYELVLRGDIKHGGNPVMRWMISNCILREYASGGLKIDKEKGNESGKIDGIDALINSLVPYIQSEENTTFVAEVWN